MESHDNVVRDSFSRQTDYISTSPAFSSQERMERLLNLVKMSGEAGVPIDEVEMLDIACGAGVVALAISSHVHKVTGIDITPAVLDKARALAKEAGATNITFQIGSAVALPFDDSSFDVITCNLAFHHFEHPEQIMAEVVRVLRPDGVFCTEDVITSEIPAEQERHQEMERLRDPSHTTNLTPTMFRRLMQQAGLQIVYMEVVPRYRNLEEWLMICPEENKAKVQALFERDVSDHLSGLDVHREGNAIVFAHPKLLLRAEKR